MRAAAPLLGAVAGRSSQCLARLLARALPAHHTVGGCTRRTAANRMRRSGISAYAAAPGVEVPSPGEAPRSSVWDKTQAKEELRQALKLRGIEVPSFEDGQYTKLLCPICSGGEARLDSSKRYVTFIFDASTLFFSRRRRKRCRFAYRMGARRQPGPVFG